MKRYFWLALAALAIGCLASLFEHGAVLGQSPEAAEVAIKGEVVDMHCYITRHGGQGSGPQHAGCANACINRGVTPGFVASDGKLYLLFDEKPFSVKEKIAGLAGQQVTLKGVIVERDGVRAILFKSAEPSK
ncbi:MAG TPA: hypothetical protein VJZ26_16520 [Blastocatellia bacterium]|nr:hypothetical protein [Blastocatellia bacterium]